MIEDKLRGLVEFAISQTFQISLKTKEIEISKPNQKEHGDFATNVSFKLAKELKKSPKEIAEVLAGKLEKDTSFKKVEALSGFINFFLAKENYHSQLEEILEKKEKFGDLDLFKGKKVQVEFISSNPTGPPTLANGRGGYGGDVISNVFVKAGAKVEREFYVNDYGNQVNILGNSVLIAAGLKEAEGDFYRGDYIDKWVEENREFIVENKENPFKIGYECAQYVLEDYIKPAIEKMKIRFDRFYSEKNLYDKDLVKRAVEFLDNKNMTYEKDGAKWLKTSEFGDDKDRVIVKSNGDYTYMTPDVAYHWEKFAERKYDLVLDILGADHHGYTARMQAAVGALGYGEKLQYLLTQMVRLVKDGQEFRMSKRKGVIVTIPDLFELIGGEENEASDVARFFFLMRSFNTHMDFDIDLAREHSEKNPVFYVKYAYARLSGILKNAERISLPKAELSKLSEEQELNLIDKLSELPQVIRTIVAISDYPVHYLTYYAIDLAKNFHSFYDKCRVIDDDDLETTAARLKLVEATKIVLGIVMRDLIGIDTPERM